MWGLHILCQQGVPKEEGGRTVESLPFSIGLESFLYFLSESLSLQLVCDFHPDHQRHEEQSIPLPFVILFPTLFCIPPHFSSGKQPQIFHSFLLGHVF